MVYDHIYSQNFKLESYEPSSDFIKNYSKAYSRYEEILKMNAASKLRKLAIDDMPDVKQRKTTLKNVSSIFVKKLMNSAFWLKLFTTVMGGGLIFLKVSPNILHPTLVDTL